MDNDIDDEAGGGRAAAFAGLSDDQLTVSFDHALAASRRAEWDRLAVEAEIDRRKMYATDGTSSLTEWITLRTGEGQRAAHHDATLARHLRRFPLVSAALAEGRISTAHAGWLITLGRLTGVDDDQLVAAGVTLTVPELQTACRAARRLTRHDDNEAHARRHLRWRCDDNGTFHFHGRIHGADGITVTTALSAIAENAAPDPLAATHEPFDTRCADALVEICTDPDRARPEVVIHVPITALTAEPDDRDDCDHAGPEAEDRAPDDPGTRDPDRDADADAQHDREDAEPEGAPGGVGSTWDSTPISAAALRRLLCDSGLRLTLDDTDGRAVGIGRRSRAVPQWLESQVRWRDGGCRFPGCEHTHWLHSHHLVHWPDGGPTDLSNLAVMCGVHHRYLHEGGWCLSGDPDGELTFTSPTGRAYASHPARRPRGRPRRRHRPNRPPPPADPPRPAVPNSGHAAGAPDRDGVGAPCPQPRPESA